MSHSAATGNTGQPAPDRPPPPEACDLDAQIRLAELAVIARDERVRRGFQQIAGRIRWRPGLGTAIGAVTMLFAALRPGRRHAVPTPAAAAGTSRGALLFLLEALWPALPASWRNKLPRGLTELLFGVVLPTLGQLLSQLFSRHPAPPPAPLAAGRSGAVRSVETVDLARYLGRWYEIARLPTPGEKRCAGGVTATYGRAATPGRLSVLKQCLQANGKIRAAAGVARIVPGSGNARLKVTFAPLPMRWLPGVWADYWVLLVDPGYRFALVGTPDRRGLWLLSRTPTLPAADAERLIGHACVQGYDTAALLRTRQRQ